jgi:gliding motility-associated-like protein
MSTGEIANWNWNFGNGMKSILQNPPVQNYFIQNTATDYTVQLIVADSAGCADTAFHVLKVKNNCYIAVPTAFTPNGDGLNDFLYPLNAYKATDLTFRVFNRNGQLVFETTDWTKKWDGNVKGDPVPADIYVWQLSYTDQSNKKVFLKGSAMLIR